MKIRVGLDTKSFVCWQAYKNISSLGTNRFIMKSDAILNCRTKWSTHGIGIVMNN